MQERCIKGLLAGVWSACEYHSTAERFDMFVQNILALSHSDYDKMTLSKRHILPACMIIGLQNEIQTSVDWMLSWANGDDELLVANLALIHIAQSLTTNQKSEAIFSSVWHTHAGKNVAFDDTWRKIGHILGLGSARHGLRHIGTQPTPSVIMTQAMYCFMRGAEDYGTLLAATQYSVDTVLVSMIAGGMFGIRYYDVSFDAIDDSSVQQTISTLVDDLT